MEVESGGGVVAMAYLPVDATSCHDVGVGGVKLEAQDVIGGLQEQLGRGGEGRGGAKVLVSCKDHVRIASWIGGPEKQTLVLHSPSHYMCVDYGGPALSSELTTHQRVNGVRETPDEDEGGGEEESCGELNPLVTRVGLTARHSHHA